MRHVFADYKDNELCTLDDAGYEALSYIREIDGQIKDITSSDEDLSAEDEARVLAISYAVHCSVNVLCKLTGVKLSKFDVISGHFTS